ncbi:MAG: sulfotransferase family protein, partial [Pseudomonadota bacterium]|nr:sulfotransferase family protein [Pseudomonadota bacterium]
AQDWSQAPIEANVNAHKSYAFTCVRNPYARILSSFFDKICGIQRNGNRYRGNLVPLLVQKYGIEVGGDDGKDDFDQIKSFRRFLLFARDTIRWRRPMEPDIHWSAMSGHISTFIVNGGRYDQIFWTETFNEGMQQVLDHIDTPHAVDLSAIPRFNESEGHGPKRAHPVEDYFDDLSMHLVYEIYKRDFELFKYDFENPANKLPIGDIDLEEVHAKLGD